ncbi:transcriptional regulator [Xylanimonas cellulosilytica DSM 15894]|uniref:Transcriptional regulator n=1 Tax=Xylanimonas cellulosilytica (strain DSM 15894 / JCM 12276 / CECT 5975 / KCTC 9989 / LMG 20990 / NBRC 107835 / XIL07) TaxID=446471 RepID=D1BRK7_XYLCX|nr:transcriptional regulator [Xylanimonas cellulosilytica]ACZ32273.1 transcriptional regulator [Xylanimonas cellulosilytica DSM 15894]
MSASPEGDAIAVVPRFDELIHPATRLQLAAALAAADWAEFAFLRDKLGLSDSALSKQLGALEDAGYVTTDRVLDGGRRRLRARLTPRGRDALVGHLAALKALLDGA